MKKGQKLETTTTTYEVQQCIGEGGAGKVYCVIEKSSGEQYAAKFLDPKKVSTDKLKRFKNELHFCTINSHKNIISVIDSGSLILRRAKIPFYIMPHYPANLRRLIGKGISREKAITYFLQILDGVEAAHLKGVIHRDLKPENILHDSHADLLIIADFGIARFKEELCYTKVETSHASRLANFQYAAPEQRARGQAVDHRADIFALGLMLNEMFTNHVPHGAGFKTVSSIDPAFGYLDDLVAAMIMQSPGDRIGSIDAIKQKLSVLQTAAVSRQKLDALSKAVIPSSEISDPIVHSPPKVLGVDVSGDFLVVKLDSQINMQWSQMFKRMPQSGLINFLPASYHINSRLNQIQVNISNYKSSINVVQDIVNQIKGNISTANSLYKETLIYEQRQREQHERESILRQISEERQRQHLLKSIKI